VRDFTDEGLREKEALLEGIVKGVMKDFPRSTYRLDIKQQYRNMKQVDRPPSADHRQCHGSDPPYRPQAGEVLDPRRHRRLAAVVMGLPCPNIFAGEHAFHSRLEWVSVQDMEKAMQTIVHLAMIWEERAVERKRPQRGVRAEAVIHRTHWGIGVRPYIDKLRRR